MFSGIHIQIYRVKGVVSGLCAMDTCIFFEGLVITLSGVGKTNPDSADRITGKTANPLNERNNPHRFIPNGKRRGREPHWGFKRPLTRGAEQLPNRISANIILQEVPGFSN